MIAQMPWQGFSLEWFKSLNDPAIVAAFTNSVIVAFCTALIATPSPDVSGASCRRSTTVMNAIAEPTTVRGIGQDQTAAGRRRRQAQRSDIGDGKVD